MKLNKDVKKNYITKIIQRKTEKEAKKTPKKIVQNMKILMKKIFFFLKIIVLRINLQKRKIITTNQISEIEMRTI